MTKDIIALHPRESIEKAESIFEQYNFHHIPVIIGSRVVGIVSKGDILAFNKLKRLNHDKFPKDTPFFRYAVEDVMTMDPICITQDTDIADAVNIMKEHRINCLPITEDNKLVGIITTFDLLELLSKKLAL